MSFRSFHVLCFSFNIKVHDYKNPDKNFQLKDRDIANQNSEAISLPATVVVVVVVVVVVDVVVEVVVVIVVASN